MEQIYAECLQVRSKSQEKKFCPFWESLSICTKLLHLQEFLSTQPSLCLGITKTPEKLILHGH